MKLFIWDVGEGPRVGDPQGRDPTAAQRERGGDGEGPLCPQASGAPGIVRVCSGERGRPELCCGRSSMGRADVAFCGAMACGCRGFFMACDHGSLPWPVTMTVTVAGARGHDRALGR